jgi:hypothetical protein
MGIPSIWAQRLLSVHLECVSVSDSSTDTSSFRQLLHFSTLATQQIELGYDLQPSLSRSIAHVYGESFVPLSESLSNPEIQHGIRLPLPKSLTSPYPSFTQDNLIHLPSLVLSRNQSPPYGLGFGSDSLRYFYDHIVAILNDVSSHLSAQLLLLLFQLIFQQKGWAAAYSFLRCYIQHNPLLAPTSVPISLLHWSSRPSPTPPTLPPKDSISSPINGIPLSRLGVILIRLVIEISPPTTQQLFNHLTQSLRPIVSVLNAVNEKNNFMKELSCHAIVLQEYHDQVQIGIRCLTSIGSHSLMCALRDNRNEIGRPHNILDFQPIDWVQNEAIFQRVYRSRM